MSACDHTKSVVWQLYTIKTDDSAKAVCNICNAVTSRGGSNKRNHTTTNLARHLKTYHKDEYDAALVKQNAAKKARIELQEACTSRNRDELHRSQPTLAESFGRKKIWDIKDPKAVAITELIGKMMALDIQPFSIAEDQGFCNLMKHTSPLYKIPHRTTFSRSVIPDLYEQCKKIY